MKAVVITRPGDSSVLELQEVADPKPDSRALLVRVVATALNRADSLQRMGKYPAPAGTRQDIPGLEYAGIVERVGPEAGAFATGDRVMGLVSGEAHAELVAVPAVTAIKVPENLTLEHAAAIPEAFLTAHDALNLQLQLRAGEHILIHAVGSGVGTAAVQLARVIGATTIGTSTTSSKLLKAQKLGLQHGIDSENSDFQEIVHDITNGRGVETILDLIGASNWSANIQCLAPRGRIILVGLLGGRNVEADLGTILVRRLHIMGTVLRSRSLGEKAELTKHFAENLLPFFEAGTLEPVIDTVFPIQKVSAAHTYLDENRNFGKIILAMDT